MTIIAQLVERRVFRPSDAGMAELVKATVLRSVS